MTSSLVIANYYPTLDKNASGTFYPPPDRAIRDNAGVTNDELREVLARNVQARIDADPALQVQENLEKRSGLGQATISRVLNSGGAATLDTIAALARGIGCQPWELLVDDEATRAEAMRRMLSR